MIRVTVELFNARKAGERSVLAVMDICNTGTGTWERGNYVGKIYRKGSTKVQRSAHVLNYPRESYVVWRLVLRMLKQCYPEEK